MFAKPTDHDWHNPGRIQLDTFFHQWNICQFVFQTTKVCIKKCPKKTCPSVYPSRYLFCRAETWEADYGLTQQATVKRKVLIFKNILINWWNSRIVRVSIQGGWFISFQNGWNNFFFIKKNWPLKYDSSSYIYCFIKSSRTSTWEADEVLTQQQVMVKTPQLQYEKR